MHQRLYRSDQQELSNRLLGTYTGIISMIERCYVKSSYLCLWSLHRFDQHGKQGWEVGGISYTKDICGLRWN
jgi:hypothetical protein